MFENHGRWLQVWLPGTVKPLFWPRPAYELDPSDPANNGFINQDFLVWMRRAALPDFRKLYRRITEGDYAQGLPAGNYSLEIAYSILFIQVTNSRVILRMVLGGMGRYICLAWVHLALFCYLHLACYSAGLSTSKLFSFIPFLYKKNSFLQKSHLTVSVKSRNTCRWIWWNSFNLGRISWNDERQGNRFEIVLFY